MIYSEAIAYIHSTCWLGSKPGLSRIKTLLEKLGNPQNDLRFIHVAGTNGKGSFCKMTESVLRHAGYRTGLFISPYIWTFNERMGVAGENISNDDLAAVTAFVKPYAEQMDDHPTEFELITAIAFVYFKQQQCDVVVLEAGMGGRLDSTNIIASPLLSVITGIAMDHTAYLGDTITAIAREKAGIIKEACPVLCGAKDEEARTVIAAMAAEKHAPLTFTPYHAITNMRSDLGGSTFDFVPYLDIHIPLLGSYQPENAASVLTAVALLRAGELTIPDVAVYEGLGRTEWNGRFELLSVDPPVIFDGSHNSQGIRAAVESIKRYFGEQKVNILCGVMKDKDYPDIVSVLKEVTARVVTVTPHNPRALDAADFSRIFQRQGIPAEPFAEISNGVQAAYEMSVQERRPLIILGSLYLYADIRKALEHLQVC